MTSDSEMKGLETTETAIVPVMDDNCDTSRHHMHRKLGARQLQLITLAGGIGSALFVLIGTALVSGGPVPLVLGMLIWCSVIWAVAHFQMEINTHFPVDGGFMTHASRFVNPAFGCAVGYNYFITSAAILNYEITIINVVLSYWFDDLNPAIVISILLVVFAVLNIWTVEWFGEVEFWVALGKVLLVFGLALFTFITMCGGNPIHDRYGFRYWHDPTPWVGDGPLDRLQALWSTIVFAGFCIVGPDFLSLMAGEVHHPRRILPRVYRSTTARLLLFYGLGALCVATVCASDDEDLLSAIAKGSAGAAKSPYVIAMKRMKIPYLGSVVNAAVLVSLLSTANTFVFTTSRSLHGLACTGQAPAILKRINRMGVPYIAVSVALALGCLSYLQMSAGTYRVLGWWVDITTCSEILTWVVMGITYIFYDKALKTQGLRDSGAVPVRARWGLPAAWYTIIAVGFTCIFQGYGIMSPSTFDGLTFFFDYAAIFIFVGIFLVWKILKRTAFVRPSEADLHSGTRELDAYSIECEEELENRKQTLLERAIDRMF